MTRNPIPVAVVGAGNMGSNHIRVYDELPEANLVEVVEPDHVRAATIREEYDVTVLSDISELSRAEAATITAPNNRHRELAEICFEAGLHLLVEKPLASTAAEARAIVNAAEESDAILQVGHIERFNPAVQTLQELIDPGDVFAIETHRLGPFNEHLAGENVVLDLMIHDLDIVNMLIPSEIERVQALAADTSSGEADHAVAQLKFDSGVVATLTASHVTHGKIRTLNLTTKDAYVSMNYQDQSLQFQRRGVEETTTTFNRSGYRTETVTESPYVPTEEPLKKELQHFLTCVRNRDQPIVDGDDGVRSLELTEKVIESAEQC